MVNRKPGDKRGIDHNEPPRKTIVPPPPPSPPMPPLRPIPTVPTPVHKEPVVVKETK